MESKPELEYALAEARVEYAEALGKITEVKKKLALLAFISDERSEGREG